MFCGTGSFKRIDEDPWLPTSAPGSPKRSKRKANKNPYSTRGLDKFSTVLAELEARREKIMAKAGTHGVSMVRFMYSNSQDWIPIIVKHKQLELPPSQNNSEVVKESAAPPVGSVVAKEVAKEVESISERKMKKCISWGVKKGEVVPWRRWPLVMLLILVCLVMFGRVFAICCTAVWWYLAPTMKGGSGTARRSMKKKDNGRRPTIKRFASSLAVTPSSQAKKVGSVQEIASPRVQGNGKRG